MEMWFTIAMLKGHTKPSWGSEYDFIALRIGTNKTRRKKEKRIRNRQDVIFHGWLFYVKLIWGMFWITLQIFTIGIGSSKNSEVFYDGFRKYFVCPRIWPEGMGTFFRPYVGPHRRPNGRAYIIIKVWFYQKMCTYNTSYMSSNK